MKLRLERAFKIASKTHFGSKMIPQSTPKSLPKSLQKVIAKIQKVIASGSEFILLQEAFKFDFRQFWERFWTLWLAILDPQVVPNS